MSKDPIGYGDSKDWVSDDVVTLSSSFLTTSSFPTTFQRSRRAATVRRDDFDSARHMTGMEAVITGKATDVYAGDDGRGVL